MPRKRRRLSKTAAKAFLATEKGAAWLEAKIAEKQAARPDPGPPPPGPRTKLPFEALINGEPYVVDRVLGTLAIYPKEAEDAEVREVRRGDR